MDRQHVISYSDALDALVALSPLLQGSCFRITLRGGADTWDLDLLGYASPAMNRLLKRLGATHRPDEGYQATHGRHETYRAVLDRVPILVTVATQTITRVSGRV